MTHAGLTGSDWDGTVDRLGGAGVLEREARATGAFRRPREVKSGVDLLRLILAYCLGERAIRMPKAQAVKAVAEARAEARSKQRTIQPGTLIAAEWVIRDAAGGGALPAGGRRLCKGWRGLRPRA